MLKILDFKFWFKSDYCIDNTEKIEEKNFFKLQISK